MFNNEGESIPIMDSIDDRIRRVQKEWVSKIAELVFRYNQYDGNAGYLATAPYLNERISEADIGSFLMRRTLNNMWAIYYPPGALSTDEPYPILHMTAVIRGDTYHSQEAPFIILPK